ncbi:N-acetyl-alpha-D-glucosaminyl L-malate synthase BshA [Agriterribacter sp.]|uniref:N-acetyl-alpha-D-glucosaminyl L-malate synthase BshA n=1 Tax=Agriterribacter sp. TaxID=2821509 RepID=UPI002C57CB1F|nr:N-acetyl-alpha-D-glucosaminyl L-malate synthase BshA [Agriterribacter sp.]HRO46209.1 N-acetyl-alpha-D-glucosaminyl L-malate synthase BshA [Agriterribacter sp.]HRQ16323.1 N-acetyl-alpha-D-glucosaminyl L-malate synthase BshA [Agriterribacter sp.]
MNIGIVCYPTFGGSGVLATELGMALADKDHNVHFITYRQPVRLTGFRANMFYHEVRVPTYPLFDYPPYESALASTLVDVVKNNKLDLLHVHYAIPHASAAYMAKQILQKENKYVPVITTLHGTDITLVGRDKTYAPVVAFSINQSDAITAVSENLKEETYRTFKIEKDIEVIYNFVDVQRFSKKPIDAFRKVIAPNNERIVLHASNFRKIKRIDDVIHIFKKLNDVIPSRLLLVGDGPERPMAEALCRELNLCDVIRFVGKQQDMEEIFAIADLFLLPSEYESFGLSALEAMAGGAPVVSTNVGGLPEIITPGENGFMGNVGDTDQMARYAIDILKDENTFNRFKANAKKQAENFDITRIVPQYEHLYERLYEGFCKGKHKENEVIEAQK